jgi:hypothetical protein
MKRIYHRPGRLLLSTLLLAFVFAGCKKEKTETPEHNHDNTEMLSHMNSDDDFERNHKRLHWRTIFELLQARWATIKYRNIQNAINDGYADIAVNVENMGHHYMKASLSDAKFVITRPEILVYRKNENGSFTLVAVEYAVPIELSPNKAPRGFFGDDDVWDRNTTFGLWLLHAWVWYKNPAGVFNPTNPNVHTH